MSFSIFAFYDWPPLIPAAEAEGRREGGSECERRPPPRCSLHWPGNAPPLPPDQEQKVTAHVIKI